MVQFHLIRVTTGMARNTHRTPSPDLFSHQIVWFVLGVSLHNSETSGKHALENLGMGAWWQKQYFPPVKADYFQTQTWQTHWYIFLLITTTALVKYLIFLKETDLLPLVARKSSGSTVSLIRCWLPCLLLPWLCETVISDDFPAWRGNNLFLSENSNTWPNFLLLQREKWIRVFLTVSRL